ncbi:MAG: ATP-binding protein, partial [Candidatus Sulfotelmatobacter sp.]
VTVEDSGTGIALEDMDRIFDTFFTTKPHGMGMGLAICRSIIEGHGGTLSASPGYPHGAVFRIVLPIGRSAGE